MPKPNALATTKLLGVDLVCFIANVVSEFAFYSVIDSAELPYAEIFFLISGHLGTTAKKGSGAMSVVAYTANAILQKTSSWVPWGWEKPMLPSLRRS